MFSTTPSGQHMKPKHCLHSFQYKLKRKQHLRPTDGKRITCLVIETTLQITICWLHSNANAFQRYFNPLSESKPYF